MSIGEDLAQARCRAGLSVTEVSRRTRIRETIINGIERDDYAACGGDFYTRGHIRAIAKAVGADPAPLITGYDAAHRAPQAATAADLFPAAGSVSNRSRPRRASAVVVLGLALAAALAVAGFYVLVGPHHAPGAPRAAAARLGRASRPRTGHAARPPSAGRPVGEVVIRLAAVEDCWVEFTTPGGRYLSQLIVAGGTSKRWVFHHAVDMRLGNPGGIKLRVDGGNPVPPGTVEPITLRLQAHGKVSG